MNKTNPSELIIIEYQDQFADEFNRLNRARDRNYRKIVLISSTKLTRALSLYEKLGFSYATLPDDIWYQTADIYMELSF